MLKTSPPFIVRAAAAAVAVTSLSAGQALAQEAIDFQINGNGQLVVTESFAARVTVLGAAITSGGKDVPVTTKVSVGGVTLQPFGSYDAPDEGDVNDGHDGPRHYVIENMFDANTAIDVTAASWLRGKKYLERNSVQQSPSVKVLRDGDPVPDIAGYDDQSDAAAFVQGYIDPHDNTMRLHKNQAIYLFELGTTDLDSAAADFQDVVVLVTLGDSVQTLKNFDVITALYD